MPRRRRPVQPRTDIPDWRDENMPVYQVQRNMWGDQRVTYEKPEVAQRQSKTNILISKRPNWSKDPSYSWRRKGNDDA